MSTTSTSTSPTPTATATTPTRYLLLVKGVSQLVTVCKEKELFKVGDAQAKISLIEDGAIVVALDGSIVAVGTTDEVVGEYGESEFESVVDAQGKSIVPGLVDGHTHPVWSGDRVHEFKLKLAGATYMEIHQAGGGIGFTVGHTRKSSQEELETLFRERLNRMMKLGTTVVEAKSGYGLDLETEVKMLKVIHEVSKEHPLSVIANYCGAHSVPKMDGITVSEATEKIVTVDIPELAKLIAADEISPTLIDVFCEKNVFEIEDTKRILEAGKAIGLEANFHGDELTPIQGGELAGDIGALAMSHCEETTDAGMDALAKRPTFATLLPTTAYFLKLTYPRAREMIKRNVPVALGSDFNPNAHCMSMPFVMNLACVNMGLTLEESLVAATINSAASLGVSDKYGSIEVGKQADFLLLGHPQWEHLIYELVDPPIEAVFKAGKKVV